MSDEIKVCPICGKVDATEEHLKNCRDFAKQDREDNLWK